MPCDVERCLTLLWGETSQLSLTARDAEND
jgi:hypothetical protein